MGRKKLQHSFLQVFSSVYGVQLTVNSLSSSCSPVFDLTISSVTYGLSNLANSNMTLFAYIFGVGY